MRTYSRAKNILTDIIFIDISWTQSSVVAAELLSE